MSDTNTAINNDSSTDDEAPASASTRFPMELIIKVVRQMSNPATLATMMRVSHDMYDLAAPILYREVGITFKNLEELYVGLDFLADERKERRKLDEIARTQAGNAGHDRRKGVVCSGRIEADNPNKARFGKTYDPVSRTVISKHELLSMIRHLDIIELPPSGALDRVLDSLIAGVTSGRLLHQQPVHVSLHPSTVWSLMFSSMDRNPRGEFAAFLRHFNIQHLCVQLPVMDRALDNDLTFHTGPRQPRRNFGRKDVHEALSSHFTDLHAPSLERFLNVLKTPCRSITIHNLTVFSCDLVLRSVAPSTTTVQAFFRPCAGADGDLPETSKPSDRYCYNHPIDGKLDIAINGFRLDPQVLSSPQQIDLIDIDWIRRKLNPGRDDSELRTIEGYVEDQIRETPEAERKSWGIKNFKMSSEVEVCKCCQRGQLSAIESSVAYRGWS